MLPLICVIRMLGHPKPVADGKKKGRSGKNRPRDVGGKQLHNLILRGDSDTLSHPYKKRRRQRKARGIALASLSKVRFAVSELFIKRHKF